MLRLLELGLFLRGYLALARFQGRSVVVGLIREEL